MSNLSEKEITEILNELKTVRPEKLTGEAKRLFEAIMKIADERDELEYKYNRAIEDLIKLEKERQADKEKIKELESDKEIKDKMIKLMSEQLTTPVHSKKWVIDYFTNKVEEDK